MMQPPGETFPQLVSFFRILGVARKNAAFECLGAIWCDMERMVPDECMVLEKYPIGSLVYVLMPAQIYGLACIIDIRGSGIGREVKVRFFKSRSNLELPDAWILERSFRLELFSRYHQDDEIDVVNSQSPNLVPPLSPSRRSVLALERLLDASVQLATPSA